ncbi:MAG: ABC transporter ATP-binding protein [Solobacterium sp.]|nr:ABC transporter ATP-binding protein [Solobacterium sp.]
MKLLMCVYEPEKGKRWVRNSSRVKQEMDSSWRRMFAYVPQGNALMSGTIRQVVSFADPAGSRDEKRLWAALETACADEFVTAMEHGVDTLLGERGTGLSEGQMQRLAVARAIFSGRPVLLLDEATSALDAASEEKLLKNIQNLKDRTVIAITHRPAALAIADRVMEFTESGVKER